MQLFHVAPDRFTELDVATDELPAGGFVWIASTRREFEVGVTTVQSMLQRWCGATLVDVHVADLINNQLPSHFDATTGYELLVFRRLAASRASADKFVDDRHGTLARTREALESIDTSPVGFAVFDRVLLTVHPAECPVREHFVQRLAQRGATTAGGRRPPGPADLTVRMVNHMVDSYLELRRMLARQLGELQRALLNPHSPFDDWLLLLDARNALHMLEDVCEDQRSAWQEWIDAIDEHPAEADKAAKKERELLRLRSRDVLEHIERVLGHVRRLELSAESAVQIHFAALGHRTNSIMRTLTVLTAVFLPLNLITGFFGMNFDFLPLIHSAAGFWWSFVAMLAVGTGLVLYFRRKRYLDTQPRT